MSINLRPYYTQGFDSMDELLERTLSYFPEDIFEVEKPELIDITQFTFKGLFVSRYSADDIITHAEKMVKDPQEKIFIATHLPLVSDFYTPEGNSVVSLMPGSSGHRRGYQRGYDLLVVIVSNYGMRDINDTAETATHELGHSLGFNHCSLKECIMYGLETNRPIINKQTLSLLTKNTKRIEGFCEHDFNILSSMLD